VRDCVVVGCGRSGTSLCAGLLASAGYAAGRRLLPPDRGNPTGHFEDPDVNRLNEELLAPYAGRAARRGYSRPPRHGERWLAAFQPDVPIGPRPDLIEAMAAALPPSPFCVKDPRFCHTLAAWRPALGDPLFVCVFRNPLATARSISREVRYGDLRIDLEAALLIWERAYRAVLDRHAREGDWLFVHYEQLLDGRGVKRLSAVLGVELDPSFAQRSLNRARGNRPVPDELAPLYDALCAAAGLAGPASPRRGRRGRARR
jgi:hypothetical protein